MSRNKRKKQRAQRSRRKKAVLSSISNQESLDGKPPQFLLDAQAALNAGQAGEAIAILKQGASEDSFAAYSGIGDIYLLGKENEKAMEWLQKAHKCRPDSIGVVISMAVALEELGRKDDAVERLSKTLILQRGEKSLSSLTQALLQMDCYNKAVETLQKMIEADGARTDVMFVLATLFKQTRQLEMAKTWYRKILELEDNLATYNQLAGCYRQQGHMSKAIEYFRKATKFYPDNIALWNNLSNTLIETGKIQEGIDLLRKAIEKVPDSSIAHGNLLFHMHHLPKIDQQTMFDEHKRWGRLYSPLTRRRTSHSNTPDPDRRLRIGYISADFCMHSVAYFFESLLNRHDRREVEVYGYGSVKLPDHVTTRLVSKFDNYQNIHGMNDELAANAIEYDKIDILVDLSGHTGGARLSVLAYKPAPIQVSYLGYPDTTGMDAIDYRLTDSVADTPQSQQFYTEELVFLPQCFLCYTPSEFASPAAVSPVAGNGYITFGSFNNNCKINPPLIAIWAEILKANENSRLLLKFRAGRDDEFRQVCLQQFEESGISPERITISGWLSLSDHLKLYNRVDISLDTYPYNGTTTTCEALWMGVPVISLFGESHMSRVSLSILTQLGLEFFAASTPDEYIAKATALAAKPDSLAKIRASMRTRIANSGLCDAKAYAGNVEAAYRKMWHKWCKTQAVNVSSKKTLRSAISID